jgi:hypothetical protein
VSEPVYIVLEHEYYDYTAVRYASTDELAAISHAETLMSDDERESDEIEVARFDGVARTNVRIWRHGWDSDAKKMTEWREVEL